MHCTSITTCPNVPVSPQSAWMPESELFPYMEFSSKFNKPSNRRGFSEALKEVDELMRKTQKGVVKTTDPSDQEVGLHL